MTRPDDWFNQVCAALGLFDGARPVSPQRVLWEEVLPVIEALKANNPEAGILVSENERVQRLWRDALAKMTEANRRSDGFLSRWHEMEADRALLRQQLDATEAARVALQREIEQWKTWCVIEIAVRNPNVSSYMEHWEGRTLKAEAELAALRARVQALVETLRALNAIVPQMDNGLCAICRLQGDHGYRSADTKGHVQLNCSNADCLSYRVAAALARAPEDH